MLDHFSLLPVPLGHIIIIAPLQWKWKWPLTGLAFPFLPCPDSVYLPLVSIALGWRHLPKNKRQNAWRMKQDFHMAGPLHYANISFCSPWNSLCWGFTGLPSVPTAEFSSVQSLSHVRLFATPQTAACQASLSITNSRSLLKFMSITSVMPSNHLIICHHLLLLLLQSFLLSGSFPLSQLFTSGGQSIGVSASAPGFQWIFRTDFLYDGLVESPCSPRDSQEFSLTPQFKSINSLALSFLHSSTLTSIHDYWKNHSLD